MKISYNWLKELIDFEAPPEKVAELLTQSGSEVEAIEKKGYEISGVVAGQIKTVDPHPQADKLTVCTVDIGNETLTAVCGAPNVKPGLNILFAKIGSTLVGGEKLNKAKIRGVESFGMILAEDELGISDDHTVVIELEDNIKPGTPLEDILPLCDHIFELEITPNRPDCLSHIGIARELKALLGNQIKYPDFNVSETGKAVSQDLTIEINDPDGCPRYTGRLLSGVKIASSPLWLKARLNYLGIRPINNVVDITNYVLLETGHPLHAFDYDMLKTKKIVVRRAESGEMFTTLDGVGRELNDGHLLITDGEKSVALAGIMGGQNSEVTESTTNILMESAYFDPVVIRRGAKTVGLSTESSQRFERGADPDMASKANNRACALIAEHAGAKVHKGMIDAYPKKFKPATIDFRPDRANAVLGKDIDKKEICNIFKGLDIEFKDNSPMKITQPSFRPDLTREIDLVEEIARIYGLDNIPDMYRPGGNLDIEIAPESIIKDRLRDFLVGRGFVEIFPLTLVDSQQLDKIDNNINLVTLQNPLSEEMSALRPDLTYSMIKTLKHNINFGNKDVKLFEIGTSYKPSPGDLADEKETICLGISGRERPVSWRNKETFSDFYSLKAELEAIFEYFQISFEIKTEANPYFDDNCSFILVLPGNRNSGYFGKISSKAAKTVGLKQDCYVAELCLSSFAELALRLRYYKQLPKYPASDRDIALIVENDVPTEDILKIIHSTGGDIVEDAFLFDIYHGKNIPEGKKSVAFRIIYRSKQQTLTDNEVDEIHGKVVSKLNKDFGAELRS